MKNILLAITLIIVLRINGYLAFTSGDDKFIKKYAMMKIYETCFGPEVVKEVRKEMKIATAKCNGNMPMSVPTPTLASLKHALSQNANAHEFVSHHQNKPNQEDAFGKNQPGFDLAKLQQAILSGYNSHVKQSSQQSHFSSQPVKSWTTQSMVEQPQYVANTLFYPPNPSMANTNDMFLARISSPTGIQQATYPSVPFPMMSASTMTGGQMYQPFYQPFFSSHRTSRVGGFDVRNQLDSLTTKMSGKIRNITCVMQELGYLNHNLEPDYENMNERVRRLPISDELKQDMTDGIEYCKQFSMCVPDERKDKFAKELVRPMFFFKCYKHKKLESCIMKDIRDRYTNEEFGEENLVSSDRSMRSTQNLEDETMEQTVFDYIYGDKSIDIDVML
ncbi:uncharacterized protein LOC126905290 [Daktulosphaira vitifoliae]|uniref:uncharacterized protein LOC126905290 n=1 Tax=Daktulosphaira vitifoliae TaxID=58002 RepID=UPI0021A984E4|nr:uncharacterized protein LOC126905290 [Daktulosphaira vitifoliae]